METIKKQKNEFHAMDFVRQVRTEMNELYLQDKQKYMGELKEAAANFRSMQKKINY